MPVSCATIQPVLSEAGQLPALEYLGYLTGGLKDAPVLAVGLNHQFIVLYASFFYGFDFLSLSLIPDTGDARRLVFFPSASGSIFPVSTGNSPVPGLTARRGHAARLEFRQVVNLSVGISSQVVLCVPCVACLVSCILLPLS